MSFSAGLHKRREEKLTKETIKYKLGVSSSLPFLLEGHLTLRARTVFKRKKKCFIHKKTGNFATSSVTKKRSNKELDLKAHCCL